MQIPWKNTFSHDFTAPFSPSNQIKFIDIKTEFSNILNYKVEQLNRLAVECK